MPSDPCIKCYALPAGPQTLFGFQLVTGQSTRVGLTAGVGEDLPQNLKVRGGERQCLNSLYCLFPSVSHAHGNAIMQSGANVQVCAVTRWALAPLHACHACKLPQRNVAAIHQATEKSIS